MITSNERTIKKSKLLLKLSFENSKQNSENVIHLEERLEKEKMSTIKVFDELADHDSKLAKEIMNQKVIPCKCGAILNLLKRFQC